MYETTYRRPKSLDEAAKFFADAGEGKFLAGGQTLIPTMKQRLAAPTDVIDISGLAELKGIEATDSAVTIGAAVTHGAVASSEAIRKVFPGLCDLAALIGDPAVREMGTIGGSLANNDPAADYPAVVLALDGTIHTNKRAIPAADFFAGLFMTALEDGEIITKVTIPVPAASNYQKFRNPASRYAMAAAFVARLKDGSIRVGITGAGNEGAFRSEEMEKALAASWSPEAIDGVTIDEDRMLSDIHGSAAYRANLVKVMAKRAVAAIG